jgi:hypothetical protein
MKHGFLFSLSIAAASLALLTPQLTRAENPNTSATENTVSPAAQQEAAQMVSGQVRLLKTLDAKKAQAGQQFEAVVDHTINLKDGAELPHGTVLVGQVATDQMHMSGTSRLALRFTEAKLKDGKTVPIRAMIAGVSGPASYDGYMSADTAPPAWSRGMLQIDEQGALRDIDLHSRIAGANSGVFVTTKKDDVKLAAGSQLSLAIAAQSNQNAPGTNGGE